MAQILDQYGKPIDRTVLAAPQTAKMALLRMEFGQHTSRGLTPARLAQIMDMAEAGNLKAQAELYEDMEEKDAHIYAEVSKRKRALLTLDWSVQPPRNASAAEKKAAEEMDELVRDLPNFEDVLLDMLNAIGHAFACLEYEWQRLGRTWLPKSITHRPQGWFRLDMATRTEIRLRNNTADGEPLLPFGWITHVHRAKSGYISRAGLHRMLAWPFLFKNYAARDLAEFLEIYGLPLRLGKYPSGAQEAEKSTLLDAVVNIGHEAAGIIPMEMEVEFKEAGKGTHEPFQAMLDWCERSVSKAVLGGTLTSGADGKSSTNALGKVHNEVRHDLLVSDARQVESTAARDIIYPLWVLNKGAIADPRRMPRLVFDTREIDDFGTLSEALPKLVGIGMRVPARYAHEKLRIPVPDDEEEVLRTVASPIRPRTTPTDAALAALAATGQLDAFPDQAALDAAMATLPADELQRAIAAVLAPAVDVLREGATPDDAMDKLIEAYPTMGTEQLQALLARAIFVADVWGRLSAEQENAG